MDQGSETCREPDVAEPSRPWLVLAVWVSLLMAVIAVQRLTVGTFESGHWQGICTPATPAEKLWYRLPPYSIILLSAVFLVGVRWWVADKARRTLVRSLGALAAVLALLVSLYISFFFYMVWCDD